MNRPLSKPTTGDAHVLDSLPKPNPPGVEPNFERIRGLWTHSSDRPKYVFTGATPRLDLAAAQSAVGRKYLEHTAKLWHVREAASSVASACSTSSPEARDAALERARAVRDSLKVALGAVDFMLADAIAGLGLDNSLLA